MDVRQRMKALGCTVSVHVYNALIAALERANQWDKVSSCSALLQTSHLLLRGCLHNAEFLVRQCNTSEALGTCGGLDLPFEDYLVAFL